MAVSWCWAFGQESSLILETQMEWEFENTGTASGQPSNTFTYTYVGSPPRFSWAQDDGFLASRFNLPVKSFVPAGWVTLAIYNDATYILNNRLVQVTGAVSNRGIYILIQNAAANTFSLFVDNIFKASFTMVNFNWHYVALQYNMSVNPWEGRVFVDGIAVTALFTDAQNAETQGIVVFQAISGGTRTNYFAQVAIYDSTADTAEVPRFVTRISPDTDSSDTGTWVPHSGAGAQVAVTANLWRTIVRISPLAKVWQTVVGRGNDVLWLASYALRKASQVGDQSATYQCFLPTDDDWGTESVKPLFASRCAGNGKQVVVIGYADEFIGKIVVVNESAISDCAIEDFYRISVHNFDLVVLHCILQLCLTESTPTIIPTLVTHSPTVFIQRKILNLIL